MSKTLLAELCQAELKKRAFQVAVLPIGSCEVHGMHLPFGTDGLVAAELARRSAERAAEKGAGVFVLPAIPFGCTQNMLKFPYTVSLQPTTVFRIFDDLIGSLAGHGIRKVLLLNGHSGNSATLEAMLREFYGRHPVFICKLDFWTVAEDVMESVREADPLIHADEIETSIALALFPELVNMKAAVVSPTKERHRLKLLQKHGGTFIRPWELYTRNGGAGHPELATREKGEKIVKATVERIGDILVELARAKMDKRFPY